MQCRVCKKRIHPERLAIAPRVTTCSHERAYGHHKTLARASAARHRARVRQTKARLKPTWTEQTTNTESFIPPL